jgi:hypothetical protein
MRLSKKFEIKQVIDKGDDVCLLYDYITIVPFIPPIPIASWFEIRPGKISFFHTHFNPTPFLTTKENGDITKALQSKTPTDH